MRIRRLYEQLAAVIQKAGRLDCISFTISKRDCEVF